MTKLEETMRALKTRINEHRKNNNTVAVVYQHITNFSHEFGWYNVKIIDYESNYKKRLISVLRMYLITLKITYKL